MARGMSASQKQLDDEFDGEPVGGGLQLQLGVATDGVATSLDDLLPTERILEDGQPMVVEWDIPQTITELAYLTHNYFRYYGKFPATIPRKLLRDLRPAPGTVVLDNFAGSGTTLVEAKLAGIPSIGVDISPLAILASKVKTSHYRLDRILALAAVAVKNAREDAASVDGLAKDSDLEKWFSDEARVQLASLKAAILDLPRTKEREFLVLAFLAIIRRVSFAYDGEVRPHVNPEKRPRDVFQAFDKKIRDMISRAQDFQALTDPGVTASAICADNQNLRAVLPASTRVGLVISHPPYLNCFDYVPVYRLEYLWSENIPELGTDWTYKGLRKSETRSWPATDAAVYEGYFSGLLRAYQEIATVTEKGTPCCVVLGDSTIHGKVVPVLDHLVELMKKAEFGLEKMIYRTTHYGIGKYAYASRADYHGEAAEKKDGIAVFRRR